MSCANRPSIAELEVEAASLTRTSSLSSSLNHSSEELDDEESVLSETNGAISLPVAASLEPVTRTEVLESVESAVYLYS